MDADDRRELERFRLLADSIGDVFWMAERRPPRVVYVNPAFEQVYGVPADELLSGRVWFTDLVHPDDRAKVREALSGPGDGLKLVRYRIVRPDGRQRWVEDQGFPARGPSASGLVVGVARDVTEQVEAEERGALQEESFRSAFHDSAIGMCLVATDGRFLGGNAALCRFFGLRHEQLLRTDFQSLTHPDDLPADLAMVRRALAGEFSTYSMEKRFIHRGGHVVWGSLTVSLVHDAGRPLRFISQVQDVTERKSVEAEVARSLREKEVLLQEVHHRVKNNLAVIDGLLGLQARRAEGDTAEVFAQSQARVRAMAVAHEMLYQTGDLEAVELGDYLRRLASLLVESHQRRTSVGLEVVACPGRLDLGRAVPVGLIVSELVTNALKHAFGGRESGAIFVRADAVGRPGGRWLELEIRDDGVGLPPGPPPGPPPESSLGVHLVQSLAGQLGGEYECESGPGGTRSRVGFPWPEQGGSA